MGDEDGHVPLVAGILRTEVAGAWIARTCSLPIAAMQLQTPERMLDDVDASGDSILQRSATVGRSGSPVGEARAKTLHLLRSLGTLPQESLPARFEVLHGYIQ